MSVVEYSIVILYSLAILILFVFALAQLNLLFNYLSFKKNKKKQKKVGLAKLPNGYPLVTIQLPVYNELYVMERLLENIGRIDYPKENLEIQLLDDSTDESYDLNKDYVQRLKEQGFDAKHLHRADRVAFKAGALKEGLESARGDFIAIFDADFLPESDWLLKTLPHFYHEKIGAIQTRWGHLNKNHSLLTKIQAFALDAHFTLEQVGRNSKGHFINFNGTAGIWRKECILDAGNWEGNTLTEDLDLSYRAQFKGWEFVYLEDVETPAELPVAISAAKSQQFRWNKGGAENFRKMIKRIIRSQRMSVITKVHAMLHLLNSTMFVNAFIIAVLSVPLLYIKNSNPQFNGYFIMLGFFVVTTLIFFVCYWTMYKARTGSGFRNFVTYIVRFFTFFSFVMGFSLHNTIAVFEGYMGKRSDFIRTPKFNLNANNKNWKDNKYISNKLTFRLLLEGILMLYFAFGIYSAFVLGEYGVLLFHVMLLVGFGYVFVQSLISRI